MVAALALGLSGTVGTPAHAAPSSSDIQKKIDKASDDLEDVVESYNKMNEDLKGTKAAEKTLAASLQPAREQLAVASSQVGVLASSAYKTGQVGSVNAVLDGPGTLMERLGMLEQLSRTRQRQINEYTEITENYETKQAALRSTQEKQTAQVKELAGRKKKIEGEIKKLYAMRTAAFGSPTESGSAYTGKIPSVPGAAGTAVTYAFRQVGKMYLYGAAGPDRFDCSGLTQAAWAKAGKSLPHNAAAQYRATARISRSQLAPGDLVFYRSLGHVGMYVGGGKIVDASRTGEPVKHRSVDVSTPYGYGRVR